MKKILALILIFVVSLCPLYVLSTGAAGDFIVENGVLLSFSGSDATVTIPDDVYYIADGAFKGNTNISKLNLHNKVQAIGNEAFYGCTSLQEVTGGDNVGFSGAYAFYNTPFLADSGSKHKILGSVLLGGNISGDAEIPDGVRMIAPYAFADNTSLVTLKTPDSLNVIGEGAFYRCTNLSEVIIGNNVSDIGPLAFSGTKIINNSKDDFVIIGNGFLLQYKGNETEATVPDTVKHITGCAFYSNSDIIKVIVPEGVCSVGERAFMNCANLKAVDLPDSLIMIDKEAFAKCKALKSATIPENVTLLGESVFYGCSSLEKAEFKNFGDIPRGTFANCTALEYVNLPLNINSIGDSAFLNCTKLTDLSASNSLSVIGTDAFKGTDNLTVSCIEGSYVYSYCTDNAINTLQCGDANTDGKVNIRDATYIQKFAASLVELSDLEKLRAECNFDGKINVRDATYIQKMLAGLL